MIERKIDLMGVFQRHRLLWLPLMLHLVFVSYSACDAEFWGEDEASVADLAGDQWLGLTEEHGPLTMSLGRAGHPPVRYVALMPFAALFGASEGAARLPGILASVGILILLYSLLRARLSSGIVFSVLMLYSVNGALSVNRSPNGTGLYVFFVLLAFWFSERSLKPSSDFVRRRKAAFWSLCLASLTYLEAVLHIPTLIWFHLESLWGQKVRSLLRYLALPGLFGLLYLLFFYVLPEPLFGRPTGALEHLRDRSGELGWHPHLGDFVERTSLVLSPFFMGLAVLCALFLFFRRRDFEQTAFFRRTALFYGPHLLVWLVFFPADFHEVLDYPFFFILVGLGLQSAWEWGCSKGVRQWSSRVLSVILLSSFIGTAHDSFLVHVSTSHAKTGVWSGFDEGKWWGPIAFSRKLGLKSLAFRVLEEGIECDDAVSVDVGGAFASFYLRGRPNAKLGPDLVINQLDQGKALPEGLRFLGLRCDRGVDRCRPRYLKDHGRFELQRDGETLFVLYDLKPGKSGVTLVQSGAHDKDWYERYAGLSTRAQCFLERKAQKALLD